MSTETVNEACGCGATFTFSGDSLYGGTRLKAWRSEHRHIEPERVGICGESNSIEGPTSSTAICDLPAGHPGWHQDGERARWGFPRWTACDGRPCSFCAPEATTP